MSVSTKMDSNLNPTLNKASPERLTLLDQIRGLAVLKMAIFHFAYDLDVFKYVDINFQKDWFWFAFPRWIVVLFLLSMGLSLPLTHKHGIQWEKLKKRFLKLAFYALIISVSTYFLFPKKWVYFGTLHCIAACSLLALPFLNRPVLCWGGAVVLLLPLSWGFQWPFLKLSHRSMDYIPAVPWLGVVLVGMALQSQLRPPFWTKYSFSCPALEWAGRHSLNIYLLHQPLFYGGIWLFYTVTRHIN